MCELLLLLLLVIFKNVVIERHVILPPELAIKVPQSHLLTETEWRNLGLQQSTGWMHYMFHKPGYCLFAKVILKRTQNITRIF